LKRESVRRGGGDGRAALRSGVGRRVLHVDVSLWKYWKKTSPPSRGTVGEIWVKG